MLRHFVKFLVLFVFLGLCGTMVQAQKKPVKKRSVQKRTNTTKTTKGKTKAKITPTAEIDSLATVQALPALPKVDSLPIPKVKKSLRPDEAVETKDIRDRIPLAYEHIRVDDAVYRHKIWREIDTREKMNLPFRNKANDNNGNQMFISILMKAIQDSAVTVFDAIDDRFTTPMTISQVSEKISGGIEVVQLYDSLGNQAGTKEVVREVNSILFINLRLRKK
ncbi:MAG: hypothetical protein WKI04_10135 [Ferruginibacter sp.]